MNINEVKKLDWFQVDKKNKIVSLSFTRTYKNEKQILVKKAEILLTMKEFIDEIK